MEEMYTIEEAAKKLHVAPEAVRQLLLQGKLKSVRGEQGASAKQGEDERESERIRIADLALFMVTHGSSMPPRPVLP